MIKIAGIGHVASQAADPAALAAFYHDVLGLEVVGDLAANSPLGAAVFLSSRPDEEHHEIAFFRDGRRAHTALRVGSLADLKEAYEEIAERDIAIERAINHGVSLSIYFKDPTGNVIEVYWPTGLQTDCIYAEPLDMTLPAGELYAQARALGVEKVPATVGVLW